MRDAKNGEHSGISDHHVFETKVEMQSLRNHFYIKPGPGLREHVQNEQVTERLNAFWSCGPASYFSEKWDHADTQTKIDQAWIELTNTIWEHLYKELTNTIWEHLYKGYNEVDTVFSRKGMVINNENQ